MITDRFFGVGCVAPRVQDVQNFQDWTKRVRNAFESVPSVQDFTFTGIDNLDFYWEGEVGSSGDEEIPLPDSGVMTFWVNIPARIQRRIGVIPSVEEVENFRVITFFDHVHPVTFIECLAAHSEVPHPSMAMVVVREFLTSELKKQQSDIDLFSIGPSPFHADFSLAAGIGDTPMGDGFSVTIEKSLAYDRIAYFCDPPEDETEGSEEDPLWQLQCAIQEEFSYFYHFMSLRNSRLNASSALSSQSQELANDFKKRGVASYAARTATVRHRLQSAQLDAISARLSAMRHSRSSKDDIERLYPRGEGSALKGYLEKVIDEDYLEEVGSAEKILEVLESRHSQEMQRFATITFSLLGVIVGAILTAAFRSWWG